MALLLALGSALTFGVADFAGGLAARRTPALTVTLVAQALGLIVLLPLLAVLPGRLSAAALVTGALAGVAGAGGLLAYFRALALGPMGLVAPLASVVGVMVPVTVGIVAGERPSTLAVVGICLGVVAVALVGGGGARAPAAAGRSAGPLLALAGGVAFGLFFVLLDRTPPDSGLWPLVGARVLSTVALTGLVVGTRSALPARGQLGVIAVSGVLDMVANILFLLATRTGLLTIAALVTSLYPVVVVVMAWHLLAERLRRPQVVAAVLSLLAVGVITVA